MIYIYVYKQLATIGLQFVEYLQASFAVLVAQMLLSQLGKGGKARKKRKSTINLFSYLSDYGKHKIFGFLSFEMNLKMAVCTDYGGIIEGMHCSKE